MDKNYTNFITFIFVAIVSYFLYFCVVVQSVLFLIKPEIYSEAFSSLISGIAALLAGIFAFYGFYKQVEDQNKTRKIDIENKIKDNKQKDLENKLSQLKKDLSTINAIKADILALIKRTERIELNNKKSLTAILTQTQEKCALGHDPHDLISIEQNYLFIFENLITDISLLPSNIVNEVFYFYTYTKGYIETLKMVNQRIKSGNFDIHEEVNLILNETIEIIKCGQIIIASFSVIEEVIVDNVSKIDKELALTKYNFHN